MVGWMCSKALSRRGKRALRTPAPSLGLSTHTRTSKSKGGQGFSLRGSDTAPQPPQLLWEVALETPGVLECLRVGASPSLALAVVGPGPDCLSQLFQVSVQVESADSGPSFTSLEELLPLPGLRCEVPCPTSAVPHAR